MFAAVAQLFQLAAKSCRQIVPPVLATLIAAGLISAYNRAFSGHLSQPRMSALETEERAAPPPSITTVAMTKRPGTPVTEIITIYEEAIAPERLWDKDAKEEAGKDQAAVKLAEPAPAPVGSASMAKSESRPEPRRAATETVKPTAPAPVVVMPPPVASSPAAPAVVAAVQPAPDQRPPYRSHSQQPPSQPPPVIMGTPPTVTVPDRANARPIEEAQTPPRSAMSTFVYVLKPSTWFAHAREFGEKIEQVGNDILPSIRQ